MSITLRVCSTIMWRPVRSPSQHSAPFSVSAQSTCHRQAAAQVSQASQIISIAGITHHDPPHIVMSCWQASCVRPCPESHDLCAEASIPRVCSIPTRGHCCVPHAMSLSYALAPAALRSLVSHVLPCIAKRSGARPAAGPGKAGSEQYSAASAHMWMERPRPRQLAQRSRAPLLETAACSGHH